jgi:hypothetical protein
MQDDLEIFQGFVPPADGRAQFSPDQVALVAVGHLSERQSVQFGERFAFAPHLQERLRP